MYRTSELSYNHYAYRWTIPDSKKFHDTKRVNELGIKYANSTDEQEKQTLQLEILQCFHGYLTKYLNMIIHGTLSSLNGAAGREATVFLKTLMPRGSNSSDRLALLSACRTLHLAFKQMTGDDIYDTLVFCMIRALNKYDPSYTDKIQLICEAISALPLPKRKSRYKEFDAPFITESVGFDSSVYLRMLVNKEYLASVAGPKKKIIGYRRGKAWPPKQTFFESGPIGLVYFLPRYFRYYLHDYISQEMSNIESKEGVLQLEHAGTSDTGRSGSESVDGWTIPHIDGNMQSASGTRLMADLKLMSKQLDVSDMTLEWVKETSDKLFSGLEVRQRYILYLLFMKGLKWPDISALLDTDVPGIRKEYVSILNYLRAKSNPKQSISSRKKRATSR